MSYKFTTGSLRQGDIYYEDDRLGASTYIDFGQDTITLRPSASAILFAKMMLSGLEQPILKPPCISKATRGHSV